MSPFMSGLMIGMTIFSALSLQWAKAELAATQTHQQQAAQARAQDLAESLEFAVLGETAENYSEDYQLKRARAFSNETGKTLGGQEVQAVARTAEEVGAFGVAQTQVALTASDDTFARAQINNTASNEALQRSVNDKETSLFNAGAVRNRQVITSQKRMEAMAEQLYAYYAAQMKFPDSSSFATLSNRLSLKDAWGQEFTYEPTPDAQGGQLSFTTPWGFTQSLGLSLKE